MSFVADSLGFGGRDNSAGRAGEAIQQFNQQAIDEIKAQFEETKTNLAPFFDAGVAGISQRTESATPEGLEAVLAKIFSGDGFKSLVDERGRAVEGQLAAGGLTRSGTALTEAARVPTDLGFQIEALLSGRNDNIVNLGQNTGLNLASFGAGAAGSIGKFLSNSGGAISDGIIGDQNAREAQSQQKTETLGRIIQLGASIFSDPALKENIEQIGTVAGLKLFQWDWAEKAKDTIVGACMNIGFMADEVQEKYPHHVGEFGGFKTINYPALLEELEGN
jgi:hypothetical protein